MTPTAQEPDVIALRPFLPAKDFEASLRFYVDFGFTVCRLTPLLASIELGLFAFLLQQFEAEGPAENYMMQMLVNDLQRWWAHIVSLDLATNFAVQSPRTPALQPWGSTSPTSSIRPALLWHIAQNPNL